MYVVAVYHLSQTLFCRIGVSCSVLRPQYPRITTKRPGGGAKVELNAFEVAVCNRVSPYSYAELRNAARHDDYKKILDTVRRGGSKQFRRSRSPKCDLQRC